MAKMVDVKPAFRGEAKVWESLERLLPDSVVVYNNREVNGREFDFCLLIEGVGILVIEVKGWLADKVLVEGVDCILVEGLDAPQRSPKKQARAYRFALLNKISEKYNSSPCVFDMVCYPFISKAEYLSVRLDIVSEETLTIFKEDLESREALLEKIHGAYDSLRHVPHAEFSAEFLLRLRRDWEPNLPEAVRSTEAAAQPYSLLSIHPGALRRAEAERIVSEYFAGIKRIVFLGDRTSYEQLAAAFDAGFKRRNIEPSANGLQIGYAQGLVVGADSFRTFNLEVYFVENLVEIAAADVVIEEGVAERELLEKLSAVTLFNAQQYQIEHAPANAHILVEAGAGTGKTFSMVSRVAFLCSKKTAAVTNLAEEIAMVTFTNDAANNMKARLKQMFVHSFVLTKQPRFLRLVEEVDRAHISTIHRFALDILRGEALYTGLGTNFRIASDAYLRGKIYDDCLNDFLARMEEENPNFLQEIPVPLYELKKNLMSMADRLLAKSVDLKRLKRSQMGVVDDQPIPYFNDLIEKVVVLAEEIYGQEMHAANALDLTECLILLQQVLDECPEKLRSLKSRYLFIDEFQDTDDVQIQVFRKLQKKVDADCRLFVVGDLKQSIYRFRGARLSAFKQLMSDVRMVWASYSLTRNYRSDRRLLERLHEVFCRMGEQQYLPYREEADRLFGSLETGVAEADLFGSVPCPSRAAFFDTVIDVLCAQEEIAASLMKEREERRQQPLSKAERTVAVLVRSNWQVEKLTDAAKKRGVELHTKSGGELYQLESTLDLYKLLLALENSANPVHLVNFIESNYTWLRLDYQKYRGMESAACLADLRRILDEFFTIHMEKTWQEIVNEAHAQPILFVLRHLYEALQPWKKYSSEQVEQRYYMANYEYLLERIIRFSRADALTLHQMTEYLKVSILTEQKQPARDIDFDDEGIQLICTTVHKAKGLEYGTVVLPYTDADMGGLSKGGLDAHYSDGKLAYIVSFDSGIEVRNSHYDENMETREQIAEESRILYVALTRAIRSCVWIYRPNRNAAVTWSDLLEV